MIENQSINNADQILQTVQEAILTSNEYQTVKLLVSDYFGEKHRIQEHFLLLPNCISCRGDRFFFEALKVVPKYIRARESEWKLNRMPIDFPVCSGLFFL